ncbi:MAG: bifunctional isocitrate dehydrogenase kinase/phosphatase [Gammaproteobacteria bacterium]|nr:bifunctional isocitrate dehydrogenase kinase/phosphatase [Gammaproteobacteria bacterium]MBL6999139.1 bifunctional isocitrate dehydrogenase kinase/phosphatase [Gammaproteobacteria bacterium]
MQNAAQLIARTTLQGFDKHYRIFLEITRGARQRFEQCDWPQDSQSAKKRITLYTQRVDEAISELKQQFDLEQFDEALWKEVKIEYVHLLYQHKQPELAETFFNSVFTTLFHRRNYNNDNIFVRPTLSTEYMDDERPTYIGLYPTRDGLTRTVRKILQLHQLSLPYEDLNRDVRRIVCCIKKEILPKLKFRIHFQIRILTCIFFRNKAGYIIGMGVNGDEIIPFALPLLNNEKGAIYVDALIHEWDDITNLFSFARSYFMVDTQTPNAVVEFLLRMLPAKSKADIYTSIGLQKQGKTEFYRNFLHHLRHSSDQLEIAPGIKGMVMTVFNLPSYPYVFKVINDRFAPPKKTTRERVKEKYLIIKMHDRVGRMADTLEYSYAAFPLDRISKELMDEFKDKIPSSMEIEDNMLIIRHLYIERRLEPLNLYLANPNIQDLEAVTLDYAQSIKDMAAANIFAGDLLLKNFGVTRHGRVIFYDYDEIEFMTDMNFRHIPEAMTEEQEMSSEPWYPIGDHDVFPEEFLQFMTGNLQLRKLIVAHASELFNADYWKSVQQDIHDHRYHDVFPYSTKIRFKNIYALTENCE